MVVSWNSFDFDFGMQNNDVLLLGEQIFYLQLMKLFL